MESIGSWTIHRSINTIILFGESRICFKMNVLSASLILSGLSSFDIDFHLFNIRFVLSKSKPTLLNECVCEYVFFVHNQQDHRHRQWPAATAVELNGSLCSRATESPLHILLMPCVRTPTYVEEENQISSVTCIECSFHRTKLVGFRQTNS